MMCPRNRDSVSGKAGEEQKPGTVNPCSWADDRSLGKSLLLTTFKENYPLMAADETFR